MDDPADAHSKGIYASFSLEVALTSQILLLFVDPSCRWCEEEVRILFSDQLHLLQLGDVGLRPVFFFRESITS